MLKSLEVRKARKLRNRSNVELKQKKLEMALKQELLHKLETLLSTNDKVSLEIHESILGSFLGILESTEVRSRYDFVQEDANIFVFSNKLTAL